jgi:hypothetical protein
MKDIKALCDQVRQTAYDIHVYHGLLINFGTYKFEIRKFAWRQHIGVRTGGLIQSIISAFSALQ